jgi:hypothetical protein
MPGVGDLRKSGWRRWAQKAYGGFLTFDIPEIGGTWRRSIGPVRTAESHIVQLAKSSGLRR